MRHGDLLAHEYLAHVERSTDSMHRYARVASRVFAVRRKPDGAGVDPCTRTGPLQPRGGRSILPRGVESLARAAGFDHRNGALTREHACEARAHPANLGCGDAR